MDSEFRDDMAVEEEPRDYTKAIWLGILGFAALMLAALWFFTDEGAPPVSRVRAEHILISAQMNDAVDRQRALELAKELRERILRGEDFATLAREYSNDPGSSQRGGDLGYQIRGTFEDPFEDYVWDPKKEPGKVYELVRTGRGYHIIRIIDRQYSAADKYELDRQRAREAEKGAE